MDFGVRIWSPETGVNAGSGRVRSSDMPNWVKHIKTKREHENTITQVEYLISVHVKGNSDSECE